MSDVYRGTYLLASLTARTGEKTSDDDVTPSLTTAYPAETPSEVAECGPAVRSVETFLAVSVDDRNGVKKKKKNEKRKKNCKNNYARVQNHLLRTNTTRIFGSINLVLTTNVISNDTDRTGSPPLTRYNNSSRGHS